MYEETIILEAEIETANIMPKISMIDFWLRQICKDVFTIDIIENDYHCIIGIKFSFTNEKDLAIFRLSHIYNNLINNHHI